MIDTSLFVQKDTGTFDHYFGDKRVFGKWTLIKYVGHLGKYDYWQASCECGTVSILQGGNLRSGGTKSCGCWSNKKDISGKRFSRLIATKFLYAGKNGHCIWEVKCDCGNTSKTSTNALLRGNTKSCGCLQPEVASELNRAELVGQIFTFLIVKSFYNIKYKKAHWLCLCKCGKVVVASTGALRTGSVKSCGCWGREQRRIKSTLHGKAKRKKVAPEYRAWMHLKGRCLNPNDKAYPDYGGRGLTVCQRWLEEDGFIHFFDDMGLRPDGTSLDRIDNDLLVDSYSKSNCRWATKDIQNRNQRTSVKSENYPEHKRWKRKFINNLVHIFRRGDKTNKFCEKYVGCTVEQLKKHIQSQFEPWMNWDNRDTYRKNNPNKVWHIEHTKPCHEFDLSKEEDRLVCFNFKNLRPYEGLANLQKH